MWSEGVAHPNIALIKYWGKRSEKKNLPEVGSLSLTLDHLYTRTVLEEGEPIYLFQGTPLPPEEERRVKEIFTDLKVPPVLRYRSETNFPPRGGLASSASAGSALGVALLPFRRKRISRKKFLLAVLRFSGSAPRSLYGGFVLLTPSRDGVEVEPIFVPDLSRFRLLIFLCSSSEKEVPSRKGMILSKSSPYYRRWVETHTKDLKEGVSALRKEDWEKFFLIMEINTFKMHTLPLTSSPPFWYWNSRTWEVLEGIQRGKREGFHGGVTMDAGPHVKLLTFREEAEQWEKFMKERIPDLSVTVVSPGGPPRLLVEGEEVYWESFIV